MELNKLTPQALRRAADLQERIQALQAQLSEILGSEVSGGEAAPGPRTGRRRLSAQGLANIRAGVAKRMARQAGSGSPTGEPRPKRRISAEARKRMAAAQRARRERERTRKEA